jgi:hypothetical protein
MRHRQCVRRNDHAEIDLGAGLIYGWGCSMSTRALPEVPGRTASVARAAFRHGSLAMRVRDELGGVFRARL